MNAEQKAKLFNRVWSKAHPDYPDLRGMLGGDKVLMSWAKYGDGLVSAKTISDEELAERAPKAKAGAK